MVLICTNFFGTPYCPARRQGRALLRQPSFHAIIIPGVETSGSLPTWQAHWEGDAKLQELALGHWDPSLQVPKKLHWVRILIQRKTPPVVPTQPASVQKILDWNPRLPPWTHCILLSRSSKLIYIEMVLWSSGFMIMYVMVQLWPKILKLSL